MYFGNFLENPDFPQNSGPKSNRLGKKSPVLDQSRKSNLVGGTGDESESDDD